MCIVGAIRNFTSQLLHYREGSSDRRRKKPLLSKNPSLLLISQYFASNIVVSLCMYADNMTEALLFLSHFMGDVHQVC